jgi:hypothetical protein
MKDIRQGEEGFFTKELNQYLYRKSMASWPQDRIIRPSQITECVRKLCCILLQMGVEEESITPRIQRIFDNGNSVHKRYLTSYLPKLGVVAQLYYELKNGKLVAKDFIEQTIENKDYWLRGSPDAVIFNPKDGLNYVFELKSMNERGFLPLTQPSWEYTAQVHLYMFLTDTPRALLFYENKNDQDVKEFAIMQDPAIMNRLLTKIRTIQKYVMEYEETKQLPECEFGKSVCKFCFPGTK